MVRELRSIAARNSPPPEVDTTGTSSKPESDVRSFARSPATAAAVVAATPTTATPIASFNLSLLIPGTSSTDG